MSEADIASMRDSGMGWGQVGHELGVHPGVLGSGHSGEQSKHQEGMATGPNHIDGVDERELREATAIDMASGSISRPWRRDSIRRSQFGDRE